MSHRNQESKPVPVSSPKNSFFTSRALIIMGVIALFLIVAIFVPW